jgi:hypothetical protein
MSSLEEWCAWMIYAILVLYSIRSPPNAVKRDGVLVAGVPQKAAMAGKSPAFLRHRNCYSLGVIRGGTP